MQSISNEVDLICQQVHLCEPRKKIEKNLPTLHVLQDTVRKISHLIESLKLLEKNLATLETKQLGGRVKEYDPIFNRIRYNIAKLQTYEKENREQLAFLEGYFAVK